MGGSEDGVGCLHATSFLSHSQSQQSEDWNWNGEVRVQAGEPSPIWRPPRVEPLGQSLRPVSGESGDSGKLENWEMTSGTCLGRGKTAV